MTDELFGRKITAVVDEVEITNLDMRFNVLRHRDATPNKAELLIYNLNESNRSNFEFGSNSALSIRVGYENTDNFVIFSGFVRDCYSELIAPDWRTTISSGDGDTAVRSARINRSYAAGTPFSTILQDCAAALEPYGVTEGNLISSLSSLNWTDSVNQVLSSKSISGSAFYHIRELLRSAGYEVSIQDGAFQVIPIGRALQGTNVLVTPQTGLIGSPTLGAKGVIKLKTLIIPDLIPGRTIGVRSSTVNGDFVVNKASYTGDTSGQDWYCELEAREAVA